MLIRQSEATAARRTIFFTAVNSTGDTAHTDTITGADILLSKAGGTEAAATNNAVHVATGLHKLELTAAECNTFGELSIRLAKTGVYNDVRIANVVAFDPYSATSLGLSNVDATISSRSSHTVADTWDLADGIETGMTPRQAMRLLSAIVGALTTGGGTSTEVFRAAVSNSKPRATVTITGANRTAITYDLS